MAGDSSLARAGRELPNSDGRLPTSTPSENASAATIAPRLELAPRGMLSVRAGARRPCDDRGWVMRRLVAGPADGAVHTFDAVPRDERSSCAPAARIGCPEARHLVDGRP